MKRKKKNRGITHCNSLFHRIWFRILVLILSLLFMTFGFLYLVQIPFLSFIPESNYLVVRILISSLYILSSLFIIHLIFDYERMREEKIIHYVCYKCLREEIKKEDE